MLVEEIKSKVIEMLAYIYKSINWWKISTSKNPYDVFNHRVRSASRRRTLEAVVSKLCNYFGLQKVPPRIIELIDELKPDEPTVIELIYNEHIYISMKAILLAKAMKEEEKKEKEKKDGNTLFNV